MNTAPLFRRVCMLTGAVHPEVSGAGAPHPAVPDRSTPDTPPPGVDHPN